MPGTLSPLVRQTLTALRRRLVLARCLQEAARLLLILSALHLAFFGLALWPGLHTLGLRLTLTLFAAVAAGLIGASLLRRPRLDDRSLAALLERQHPALGERLLSTVELAHAADAHGDPAFIAQLAAATDQQLHGLDNRNVCSLRRPARWAALATAGLLGLTLLFALSPRYGRFCGRFFSAWTATYTGYEVRVLPGDAYAARGGPATVEARLHLLEDDETLPAECQVVVADAEGKTQRLRMDPAPPDRFLFSWPRLEHDITFHVEAGAGTAGPFRLTAVDAVQLAETPVLTITPPPYVNPQCVPLRTQADGLAATALQHGRLLVELRFSARPVRALLTVSEASGGATVARQMLLVDDEGHAAVDLPAHRCGTFAGAVRIESEHGITTTQPLPAWTIRADTAPHFAVALHIHGVRDQALRARHKAVALDEPLRLLATVEDAEGLGALALEYRVNDGPTVMQALPEGAGRLVMAVERLLPLPRGLKEGDRFRFRLRAADNRQVARLGPHVVYSPAGPAGEERWIELRIGKSAESLLRREIAAQQGEVDHAIEQIRQQLQKEHGLLGQVRQASHQQAEVRPAQLQQLAEAARLNEAAAGALAQLAAQLAAMAELAALDESFLAIAENELAQAARAMVQWQRADRSAAARTQDAQAGEAAVLQALRRLNDLERMAERLGQGRLDQLELERLGLKEQELAGRVEELLADGEPDAAALAELRAEQDHIAGRLRELTQQSEPLRDALAQSQATLARQLAEQAGKLAKEQRAALVGGSHGKGAEKRAEQMKQLAEAALKLAQQDGGPEAKQAAMHMQQALSKPNDAEAMRKLEMVAKALAGVAGKMAGPGEDKLKTAAALAQGQKMVRAAQQQLRAQPRSAPRAMRLAAGALDRAARQLSQQLGQAPPRVAGRPALGAGGAVQRGRVALPKALARQLEPFAGKAWGELPGALKTQLLQSAREQFGDEYAPIIQHYFERLADAPRQAVPASKQP